MIPATRAGTANDYRATGSDDIVVVSPVVTKWSTRQTSRILLTLTSPLAKSSPIGHAVTIPQSTLTSVQFVDTPDTGLAIVDVVSLTASAALCDDYRYLRGCASRGCDRRQRFLCHLRLRDAHQYRQR